MKNQGGTTLRMAEQVFSRRAPSGLAFSVYIDREATLAPDLSEINHRTVRDVSIVTREGFDDEQRLRLGSLDEVVKMRDALSKALALMDGEWFSGERVVDSSRAALA